VRVTLPSACALQPHNPPPFPLPPPAAGWNVGTLTDVGQVILAQRFAPMGAVVTNDLQSWGALGGNEYNCG
jgi:hypothetical protein